MPRPRDHDKFDSANHILPAEPGLDFGERVGADHEEHVAARPMAFTRSMV